MAYLKFLQATLLSTSIFIIGSTPSIAMEEETTSSSSSIHLPVASSSSDVQPAYEDNLEYQRHQDVSNRFFRRLTRKPVLRVAIENFKQELTINIPLSRISLDGLSSRTRILLFREVTAHASARNISIPFLFHGKDFEIDLSPSLTQPGDGIINKIGTSRNIFEVLNIFTPEYQKIISEKLIRVRKAKSPYHPDIPYPVLVREDEKLDLEILNILLDFEVAKRLQGTPEEEKRSFFAKELEQWGGGRDAGICGASDEQNKKADLVLYFEDFVMKIERNHKINIHAAKKDEEKKDIEKIDEETKRRERIDIERRERQLNNKKIRDMNKYNSEEVARRDINRREKWDKEDKEEIERKRVSREQRERIELTEIEKEKLKNNKKNNKTIERIQKWKLFHDSAPIASAIIGALKSSGNKNPIPLKAFFRAYIEFPDQSDSFVPFCYFNAFEGANILQKDRHGGGTWIRTLSENKGSIPSEKYRKFMSKSALNPMRHIIKELRGGENAQNSSKEEIHREYLDFFGGDSESDGEDYEA
jgi:hypothetical protein